MKAVLVKHIKGGKGYWFEVPEYLANNIKPNMRVICDTSIGQQNGMVASVLITDGEDEAKEVMISSGAEFPLRKVVAVECNVPIEDIKIPWYLAHSTPNEKKIVKRFLEYYRTGKFNTSVTIDDNYVLTDGYTAYLMAKMLHLTHIVTLIKWSGKIYF